MTGPVRDAQAMIAGMNPELDERRWCFVAVTPDRAPELLGAALGTFREDEGVSAIVPVHLGGDADPVMARITLTVHSDMEGFGLTAAVSGALAQARIACNVVAALHHDHLFVPADEATRAMTILQALQDRAGIGSPD